VPRARQDGYGVSPERKGRGPHKIEKRRPFGPRSVLRDSKKGFREHPSKQLVLRPACTVRTWHPPWLGINPLLPATDGSSVTDQRSGKRLLTTSVETDFWIRPFTRQRRRLPCGFPRSRVVAPGLHLQNHPGSSASLVRFLAPDRALAFTPSCGTITAGKPVAKRSFQDSSFVFRPLLPSRTLDPSGS
jgi:hypothetical protein